uniref:cytochrome b n=1 Tax=uncultured Sphingomonas sp. TaxID=158754 RepID=UPI0035CBE71C
MATSLPPGRAAARYSTVAIALHWAIALLILYNLTSGLLRAALPREVFQFHVSSGITILVLSIVRVGWRLTHRPPPLLEMKTWERRSAHCVHALLYAAILILPVSGWALVSAKPPPGSPGAAWSVAHPPAGASPAPVAAPRAAERPRGPTMVWGLFKLPLLTPITSIGRTPDGIPTQRALRARIETFHWLGAWAMLALLVLHIAGALKHQWIDRQRELARMGIGG